MIFSKPNLSTSIAAVFGIALAVRLLLFLAEPIAISSPDTATYFEMARQLQRWDFSEYTGERTPVYPLLVLACLQKVRLLIGVQLVMGALSSAILAFLIGKITGARWGIASALLFSLSFYPLIFEKTLLAESSFTFLLLSSLGAAYLALRQRGIFWPCCSGLLASLAALCRPVLVPVLLLYALFFLMLGSRTTTLGLRLRKFAVCVLASLLPLLAWSFFNLKTVGYFGPTTLPGLSLTQHAGAFLDRSSQLEQEPVQTFIKYRNRQILQTGSHSMTIWQALPELMANGHTWAESSKIFQQASLSAIANCPTCYLKSVRAAWLGFWLAPNLRSSGLITSASLAWDIEEAVFISTKILGALVAVMLLLAVARGRQNFSLETQFVAFLGALVLATSFSQALFEYGENDRYSLPFFPLMVGLSAWGIKAFSRRLRGQPWNEAVSERNADEPQGRS